MSLLPRETTASERHLLDRIESLETERDLIMQGLRDAPPTSQELLKELRKALGPFASFQVGIYVLGETEEWRISGTQLPCISGVSAKEAIENVHKWLKSQAQ